MKLIYTHENRFIVNNMKNIVENARIDTLFKNEYIAGAAGDLAPLDTWLELWVENDEDYEKAIELIKDVNSKSISDDWVCPNCNETNSAAFELCWNCQHDKNA